MLRMIKKGARALDRKESGMGLSKVGRRKTDMAFVKYKLTEVRRLV